MSPNGTDEELRVSVRERLADGRLPWASGSSTVRQGTGAPATCAGGLSRREASSARCRENEVPTPWRMDTVTGSDVKNYRESNRHRHPPSPEPKIRI